MSRTEMTRAPASQEGGDTCPPSPWNTFLFSLSPRRLGWAKAKLKGDLERRASKDCSTRKDKRDKGSPGSVGAAETCHKHTQEAALAWQKAEAFKEIYFNGSLKQLGANLTV